MPNNIQKYTNTISTLAYSKITASKNSQHKENFWFRKPVFTFLLSVHNIIRLSSYEQVCLMNLHFERYFSHHRKNYGRSIYRNVTLLKTLTAWKKAKYGVFSDPYFPAFGLNTDIYSVNLRIQSEYEKIRTRKSSVFGDFSRSDLSMRR